MSIRVHLHPAHRDLVGGLDVLHVEGRSIGECVSQLVSQYPRMEKALFDSNGKLKQVIEIYLNQESTFPDELEKAVKDGDDIHITVLLAGG